MSKRELPPAAKCVVKEALSFFIPHALQIFSYHAS